MTQALLGRGNANLVLGLPRRGAERRMRQRALARVRRRGRLGWLALCDDALLAILLYSLVLEAFGLAEQGGERSFAHARALSVGHG